MSDIERWYPLNARYILTEAQLTAGEQSILVDFFGQPVVKKYLEVLTANTIKDFAHIPLSTIAEDGAYTNALKQAFFKGQLSMLQTLTDIKKEEPTSVQANQQGQRQQR